MMAPLILNCAFLQLLMKKRGWSNDSLSKAVGVSKVSLVKWRNGKSGISARNLIKLAKVLKVDKHALLESDDQKMQMYLRQTLLCSIQSDPEPQDMQTILQIMKTLGMNIVATQKVEIETKEDLKPTEVEDQALRLLYGKKNIEGDDTSNRE